MNKNHKAFTLAEMMVVMLILTILLAAFAPLMTKRKTLTQESPWRWAENNSDIYFGLGDAQSVGIGTQIKGGKVTINSSSEGTTPVLAFVDNNGDFLAGFGTSNSGTNFLFRSDFSTKVTGQNNTAYGYNTLSKTTSGSSNVAIGTNSLSKNTTGNNNLAIGLNSLKDNTTGSKNTAIGTEALYKNVDGENITAIGYKSLYNNTASNITAVGYQSLMSNTSGIENTALGYSALASNTSGNYNVAVGSGALQSNTIAEWNTAVGLGAMQKTTTGSDNTAMGASALVENVNGTNNVAFGYQALSKNTSGSYNTAIGTQSLANITTGSYNTALGYQACKNIQGNAKYKTCIGANSGPSVIDNESDSEIIYLGSTSLSAILSFQGSITTYSDARLKNIQGEFTKGLEQIRDIVPKYFVYKADENKQIRLGVIAQELQKALPEAVKKSADGYYVVQQEYIKYALLNAVKQLDKLVQGLTTELKNLVLKVTGLEDRIKVLEEENKKLKEQVKVINKRLDKLEQDD